MTYVFAAAGDPSLVQDLLPLIGTFLGGGLLASIVAWRKSGAEKDSIAITATRTALEVFEASIKQLREDLEHADVFARLR